MKKLLSFIVWIFTTIHCMSQINIRDSMMFQNGSSMLILYEDSTFVELQKNNDICKIHGFGDDTITFGKYVMYKSVIYLYSDTSLYNARLPIVVEPQMIDNKSYTIIVSSPYTKAKDSHPSLRDNYIYMVEIVEKDTSSGMTIYASTISYSDTICVKKTKGYSLEKFSIYIYPYHKHFYTKYSDFHPYLFSSYINNDNKNNFFYVQSPKFTPMFNYYGRYNGKNVEIINKKVLIFDRSHVLLRNDCHNITRITEHKIKNYLMKNRLDPYEVIYN